MIHRFHKIVEATELEHRSYSGRCMYGAVCIGFTTSNMGALLAELTSAAAGIDELPTMVVALNEMRWDSMGLDIIAYFPSIPPMPEIDDEG